MCTSGPCKTVKRRCEHKQKANTRERRFGVRGSPSRLSSSFTRFSFCFLVFGRTCLDRRPHADAHYTHLLTGRDTTALMRLGALPLGLARLGTRPASPERDSGALTDRRHERPRPTTDQSHPHRGRGSRRPRPRRTSIRGHCRTHCAASHPPSIGIARSVPDTLVCGHCTPLPAIPSRSCHAT